VPRSAPSEPNDRASRHGGQRTLGCCVVIIWAVDAVLTIGLALTFSEGEVQRFAITPAGQRRHTTCVALGAAKPSAGPGQQAGGAPARGWSTRAVGSLLSCGCRAMSCAACRRL
jgi:hypothetical protein